METVFAKVAGLDVHQKLINVGECCRLETGKIFAEVRELGTMTRDLRALADYLEVLGVTHVTMESTVFLGPPAESLVASFEVLGGFHRQETRVVQVDIAAAAMIETLLATRIFNHDSPHRLRDRRLC